MKDKEQLLIQNKKDIIKIEKIIKKQEAYNKRNRIISSFLKSGLALDYIFPFLISAVIIFNVFKYANETPFKVDKVETEENVEVSIYSTGIKEEKRSFKEQYDKELLEHSTAWKINDFGLYERVVTSYVLNDGIDINTPESIFMMTPQELQHLLVVDNIHKIQKSTLNEEDQTFNEEVFVLTCNYSDSESVQFQPEPAWRNFNATFIYILDCIGFGYLTGNIYNLLTHCYIKTKLKDGIMRYRKIDADEIIYLKSLLEIKKNNISLLEGNPKNLRRKL